MARSFCGGGACEALHAQQRGRSAGAGVPVPGRPGHRDLRTGNPSRRRLWYLLDHLRGESDHPDVDELYNRVSKIDPKISIATVYRTVKLFEESGILTKHEFKGGKARYEELNEGHHDHLIDVKTGEIIEFVDEEIEKLQKKVAEKYGYKLVDHKLELYGVKKKSQ